MPTAHLICGYIGSGKTTFARQLEADTGARRFTHDEWMVKRYGVNPPADRFEQYYDEVSADIWQAALERLAQGQDVILDFGFWKRSSRDDARARLSSYDVKFYVVVCDLETAWSRVQERNHNLGSEYLLIEKNTFEKRLLQVDPIGQDENIILVDSTA
jgi:predicted kinase